MTTKPRVKPSRTTFSITSANAERFRNARSQVQARMQLGLGRSVSFEETIIVALERMGERQFVIATPAPVDGLTVKSVTFE